MQTFLPNPDFATSARLLDHRRLGKQRVEVIQVVRGLTVPGYGWRHHPAVRMWRGSEEALGRYGLEVVGRWCDLGFADSCGTTIRRELATIGIDEVRTQDELAAAGLLPPWLGDPEFHRSHRSALVRKDPRRYRALFPDVPDDLPYLWPDGLAAADERVPERIA